MWLFLYSSAYGKQPILYFLYPDINATTSTISVFYNIKGGNQGSSHLLSVTMEAKIEPQSDTEKRELEAPWNCVSEAMKLHKKRPSCEKAFLKYFINLLPDQYHLFMRGIFSAF